jgi:ketosteroid isomerase-like protein
LDKAPLALAQQAEDLLARAAGEQAPKESLEEDAAARARCRRAWEAWWAARKGKLDLAAAELRSPFAGQSARARGAAKGFVDAIIRGDADTMRKLLDAPFVIDPMLVLKTRAEVDALFRQVPGMKQENFTYKITKVIRFAEYARQPKRGDVPNKQEVLKELPRPGEIRAVYVDAIQNGRPEPAAVLVRVRGTRAWVVGLGMVTKEASAKGRK